MCNTLNCQRQQKHCLWWAMTLHRCCPLEIKREKHYWTIQEFNALLTNKEVETMTHIVTIRIRACPTSAVLVHRKSKSRLNFKDWDAHAHECYWTKSCLIKLIPACNCKRFKITLSLCFSFWWPEGKVKETHKWIKTVIWNLCQDLSNDILSLASVLFSSIIWMTQRLSHFRM